MFEFDFPLGQLRERATERGDPLRVRLRPLPSPFPDFRRQDRTDDALPGLDTNF